jgi:alpha/beta superfamily hydrolase
MLWGLLWIAGSVYVGLCLVFLVFQRSFIYLPTSAGVGSVESFTLERPDATLRISTRPHDGPGAVVYFGGNAEPVAWTVPELAGAFPDRAIYALHYRGYGGSSGRPAEGLLRGDARALFGMVHDRHPDVIVVGRSIGSSLAIQLAAEEPVSRLALITPIESILAIARRAAPLLPIGLLLRDRWESWRFAPRVTCPTFVVAGSRPGVATLEVVEGGDHNSVSGIAEFREAIAAGE